MMTQNFNRKSRRAIIADVKASIPRRPKAKPPKPELIDDMAKAMYLADGGTVPDLEDIDYVPPPPGEVQPWEAYRRFAVAGLISIAAAIDTAIAAGGEAAVSAACKNAVAEWHATHGAN